MPARTDIAKLYGEHAQPLFASLLNLMREANCAFTLYFIGLNEKNDGGVAAFKKCSTPDLEVTQGDWVWRYP